MAILQMAVFGLIVMPPIMPVSAEAALEPPFLLQPAPGHSGELLLMWTKVVNATGYAAQVAQDLNFTSPRSIETGMSRTTFADLPEGWYFARVAAQRAGSSSNWSDIRQTYVYASSKLEPPSFTSLTGKGSNATCQWTAVPSAGRYLLEICADPGFDPPLANADVNSTAWTFTNLTNGVYQVRVRAYNVTAWSDWTTASILISASIPSSGLPTILTAVALVLIAVALAAWVWRRRG
jgi:hypothetical protein